MPTAPLSVTIHITKSGSYVRNVTDAIYIVNATGNVTVSTDHIAWGHVTYVVLPNAASQLTINNFNVTSDVIDLAAFSEIHTTQDLTFSDGNPELKESFDRQLIYMSVISDLRIFLTDGQIIHLANISTVLDLSEIHFMFATKSSNNTNNNTNIGPGAIITGSVLCGSLILYILYQGGVMYRRRSELAKLNKIVDWDEVGRTNPTYVSFVDQDSWRSEDSDLSSNLSSSDGDTNHSSSSESKTIDESVGGRVIDANINNDNNDNDNNSDNNDAVSLSSDDSELMNQLMDDWSFSDSTVPRNHHIEYHSPSFSGSISADSSTERRGESCDSCSDE
jgi:hypothetical protein